MFAVEGDVVEEEEDEEEEGGMEEGTVGLKGPRRGFTLVSH